MMSFLLRSYSRLYCPYKRRNIDRLIHDGNTVHARATLPIFSGSYVCEQYVHVDDKRPTNTHTHTHRLRTCSMFGYNFAVLLLCIFFIRFNTSQSSQSSVVRGHISPGAFRTTATTTFFVRGVLRHQTALPKCAVKLIQMFFVFRRSSFLLYCLLFYYSMHLWDFVWIWVILWRLKCTNKRRFNSLNNRKNGKR